jgi:hypothetical protein
MRQQLCTLVAVQNWTVIWHACHGTHTRVHTHTYTHTHTYYAHIHKQLCTHVCVHNSATIVYTCFCTQLDNDMAHVCVHNWTSSAHSCVRCLPILDWPFTKSVFGATKVSQNNCVNVCSIPQMRGRLVFIKAT